MILGPVGAAVGQLQIQLLLQHPRDDDGPKLDEIAAWYPEASLQDEDDPDHICIERRILYEVVHVSEHEGHTLASVPLLA